MRKDLKRMLRKAAELLEEYGPAALGGLIAFAVILAIIFGIYTISIAPKEGTIVMKKFVPAHTYVTHETVYKDGERIRIPVTKYQEEQYQITIEGISKKGEMMRYTFAVPAFEYEMLKIGDWYIREGAIYGNEYD